MPYYRVMLRGHNFPGDPIFEPGKRFGLFTTRFVQAVTAKRAEGKAVALAWRDPELEIPPARKDEERAWLTLAEVECVHRLPRFRGGGATWFSDAESQAIAYRIQSKADKQAK